MYEIFSTHILDEEHQNSYCGKAVLGDRAITIEQVRDPDCPVTYDCIDCYNAAFGGEGAVG